MNGTFWLAIVLGGVMGMIVNELTDLSGWVAPKIVVSAARRLRSPAQVERYAEEWQAELLALEGLKLAKLFKALSIWLSVRSLARSLDPAYVSLTHYIRFLRQFAPEAVELAIAVGPDSDVGAVKPMAQKALLALMNLKLPSAIGSVEAELHAPDLRYALVVKIVRNGVAGVVLGAMLGWTYKGRSLRRSLLFTRELVAELKANGFD